MERNNFFRVCADEQRAWQDGFSGEYSIRRHTRNLIFYDVQSNGYEQKYEMRQHDSSSKSTVIQLNETEAVHQICLSFF